MSPLAPPLHCWLSPRMPETLCSLMQSEIRMKDEILIIRSFNNALI